MCWETTEFLELFLRNLLLREDNELRNRAMHISGRFDVSVKANIQEQKANIERVLTNIGGAVTDKTIQNITSLYEIFRNAEMFTRKDVEQAIGVKATRAYELCKLMLDNGIITSVNGHGKGKYRFL